MNQKISLQLFISFHGIVMLAEKVIDFANKLHIEIEEIDCKSDNKQCKKNTEYYKNNFHIIYPDLSGVHIQPHRERP